MLRSVPHPAGVAVSQVVCPINFTNRPLQFESPPPLLGQHTEKILTDLGYDAAQVRQLRDSGIV